MFRLVPLSLACISVGCGEAPQSKAADNVQSLAVECGLLPQSITFWEEGGYFALTLPLDAHGQLDCLKANASLHDIMVKAERERDGVSVALFDLVLPSNPAKTD
ncbi:hypothetical protein [Sphingobium terrigena]|uniref:hypothetical protein n=1 Tax=Sphingobium terrigena TaxID=2304063 RepID=UPI0011C3EC50|nr:hypothetical protein [Sphingobium terrigena]